MAKSQKFTEDEMNQIQELQKNYQDATATLGRLSVQEIILSQQIENVDNERENVKTAYSELQKKEQTLVQTLNDKYVAGTLDIVSGEFTPTDESTSQGPAATPNS